jgi:MSHA pilin protein MshA
MSKSARRGTHVGFTQGGFTLIELVVVIVILGILAAFAVPRFARMDREARVASVRSLEGALRSSSAMTHGLWLAGGNPANVAMEGATIPMTTGGFPTPTATGIQATLQPNTVNANVPGRFTAVVVNATTIDFRMNGATTPTTCQVRYVVTATGIPTITANPTAATC